MRRTIPLALLATLAACGKPTSDDASAPDGKGVPTLVTDQPAQTATPAAEPFDPQPIVWADIEAAAIVGAGCAFIPAGGKGHDAVMVASSDGAVMKRQGKPVTLTPDVDSPELPYGTRQVYVGTGLSIEIGKGGGDGTVAGEETVRWPGTLTVRDQQHRVSYQAAGSLECGA